MFEQSSFPIDPDITTIENCRRRVEQDTDILILIIGGRYGSLDEETSKSVTNLEYIAARNKGIPIYAFVDKNVHSLLGVWRRNKDADFSHQVDSPNLFEFIDQVGSKDKVWMSSFETAGDIISVLRPQFSYLLKEGLENRSRIKKMGDSSSLTSLTSIAFRLALEKPMVWEYLLFTQVWIDEIEASKAIRQQHKLGINFGYGQHLPPEELGIWAQGHFKELRRVVHALSVLIDKELPEAIGPKGQAGDVEKIIFVSRQIGLCYRQAIDWSQRIRRTFSDAKYEAIVDVLADFADDIIGQLETLCYKFKAEIEQALPDEAKGIPVTLKWEFNFEISNYDKFAAIMDELEKD